MGSVQGRQAMVEGFGGGEEEGGVAAERGGGGGSAGLVEVGAAAGALGLLEKERLRVVLGC